MDEQLFPLGKIGVVDSLGERWDVDAKIIQDLNKAYEAIRGTYDPLLLLEDLK